VHSSCSPSLQSLGLHRPRPLLRSPPASSESALALHRARGRQRKTSSRSIVVGLPVRRGGRGLQRRRRVPAGDGMLGVVPKSYLPNYREFEERRWFRPGTEVAGRPSSWCSVGDSRGPVRHRPALRRRQCARPRWWASRSARTTGCRCRRACLASVGRGHGVLRTSRRRTSPSARPTCADCSPTVGSPTAGSAPTSTSPPAPASRSTDLAFDSRRVHLRKRSRVLAELRPGSRANAAAGLRRTSTSNMLVHERLTTGSFGDCAVEHGNAVPPPCPFDRPRPRATLHARRRSPIPSCPERRGDARPAVLGDLRDPDQRPAHASWRPSASPSWCSASRGASTPPTPPSSPPPPSTWAGDRAPICCA
jgi:hypothetical protein